MRHPMIVLATLGAVLMSSTLPAQDAEDPDIGKGELPERYKTFDQLDRDNNGLLDQSELDAYGANSADKAHNRGERILRALDEDRDGAVTPRELSEGRESIGQDSDWW